MNFHTQFNAFIRSCREYQKQVDDLDLHFSEPYQSIYLELNKVVIIHTEEKLNLEAMEAGEQTAPGFPNLTPARREYYELEAVVPTFLANGGTAYYHLQRYKIACTYLVKTFSYSTYKGDWEKMRNMGNWLGAIYKQQDLSNTEDSFEASFDHLRDLGNFNSLGPKELQELEEEVRNIQALLIDNPELQENLSPDDAELLQEAVDYLQTKQDILKGLPELDDDFKYDEPPVLEVVAYRCTQLTVLLDNFHERYDKNTPVIELNDFKQALRDAFDLHVGICTDIYKAMLHQMASYQSISIKKLCTMLHQALKHFTEEDLLSESYGNSIYDNHIVVSKGMPDTIDFEMLLMLAVGDF
ncbi:MAG: hypothetical protein ACI976_001500 [Aureispira sp.]|jgi:hypothetical protein